MWRCIALVLVVLSALPGGALQADDTPAWKLEEAMAALARQPDDAFLQYVALQLGQREGRADEVAKGIRRLGRNRGRGAQADLYRLFAGRLAVQESLQLDTMLAPSSTEAPEMATVDIATLPGSQVRSHPWKEMLGDQEPTISALALCVPADQYFARFESLNDLLDIADTSDIWGTHALSQAQGSAHHHDAMARLRTQLAVEVHPEIRPFYRLAVGAVAVTGNDLYLREGSDITLLFEIRNDALFRNRMDGYLNSFESSHKDTRRSSGSVGDVAYEHLTTPERTVHVFSAYPRPGLHVRSNSLAGMKRVLQTLQAEGRGSLGTLDEFRYVRTLMPLGATEEHGFVYLSDPFVRRITGPQVKITERRRLVCHNHLMMISHASLLHRQERGRMAAGMAELSKNDCLPARFGQGLRSCPEGGNYRLSTDGRAGLCSHHGTSRDMTPCVDIAVDRATDTEVAEYEEFLDGYNRYWRTFFDPIAVRLQVTPDRIRMETIVLPLLDNSIYTAMASTFGGAPARLDAHPVSKKSIFTLAFQLDKEKLLTQYGQAVPGLVQGLGREAGLDGEAALPGTEAFLRDGIGDQIALHLCDGHPHFELNYSSFFAQLLGSFGRGRGLGDEELFIGVLISALNGPVYVAMPLNDPAVVDRYLDEVDDLLGRVARQPDANGWFRIGKDAYQIVGAGERKTRCFTLTIGPVKWRLFWERIASHLYVSSQKEILDELVNAPTSAGTVAATGHAAIQIHPTQWEEVLASFRLGWAENNRHTCLRNLHHLDHVGRLYRAEGYTSDLTLEQEAQRLLGVRPFCPELGHYEIDANGNVACSHHRNWGLVQQEAAPRPDSPSVKLLEEFSGMTAALTFTEEGLRAVLTVDR